MKLKWILLGTIVLLPSIAASQWSEVKQNQLATYGTSTLYYSADRAQLTYSVVGLGSTIEEAITQASEKATRIGAKLKSVGVSEKQMMTSYFNSADNPEGKSWWTSSKDFAARYSVTITIDSFGLIQPIIAALAGEPIESVSKLTFSLKNDWEKQLVAHKAAAEDARRKADLIAATLGSTINRVLYVEDQSSGSGYGMEAVAISAAGPYVFSGKQFPVSSRLRVVFELGEKQ